MTYRFEEALSILFLTEYVRSTIRKKENYWKVENEENKLFA